jgi:hypothetical protein
LRKPRRHCLAHAAETEYSDPFCRQNLSSMRASPVARGDLSLPLKPISGRVRLRQGGLKRGKVIGKGAGDPQSDGLTVSGNMPGVIVQVGIERPLREPNPAPGIILSEQEE